MENNKIPTTLPYGSARGNYKPILSPKKIIHSLPNPVPIVVEKFRNVERFKDDEKKKVEYRTPWWAWILLIFFVIFIVLLGFFIFRRYIKKDLNVSFIPKLDLKAKGPGIGEGIAKPLTSDSTIPVTTQLDAMEGQVKTLTEGLGDIVTETQGQTAEALGQTAELLPPAPETQLIPQNSPETGGEIQESLQGIKNSFGMLRFALSTM